MAARPLRTREAENGIAPPEGGTLEAVLTAPPEPARLIPTHRGAGFAADAVAALKTRAGSDRNRSYVPLGSQSFTDFDWLAVLDSATYNRGGRPLSELSPVSGGNSPPQAVGQPSRARSKQIMDEQTVTRYILDTFPDVETTDAYGYTFFFYRDDHMLPFATIAAADNEHDRVSNLDRPGVFRINIGVSKQTFQTLFGTEGRRVEEYDFTALDTLMPHPEYAAQSFICVLSPGHATAQQVRSLLAEAYERSAERYHRRHQRPAENGDDEGTIPSK